MNLFKNLFKKKLKPNGELKICIVEEHPSDLYVIFGITDERKKELHNIVKDAVNQFDDLSLSYEYIVDNCKHINEVVICVIITERLINSKSQSLMHGFFEAFKNF
jgi:hypothetical protein